ncbi:MAG: hydrogenase maturation protease [Thermoproteota archaeon]
MRDPNSQYEEVKRRLKEWLAGAEMLMVLGVGNELRGDDAAGIIVARRLEGFNGDRFEVVECGASLDTCLDYALGKNPSHILIIDAFLDGGRLMLLDLSDIESNTPFSTHAIPIPLLLEALGKPEKVKVKVLGIGIDSFELGESISEKCVEMVGIAVKAIREVVEKLGLV